jgi:hypothetical protein
MSKLRWFVNELAAIEHLDFIRIGTRVPSRFPSGCSTPPQIDGIESRKVINPIDLAPLEAPKNNRIDGRIPRKYIIYCSWRR